MIRTAQKNTIVKTNNKWIVFNDKPSTGMPPAEKCVFRNCCDLDPLNL